ncbi:Polysaccharide biosynthesis protein [Pseudoalteromonas sp. P1-9]|uniref:lipopolysaccharide biosynthesis protein n=1 Tax=Pseudoalteromonas sp. P1-9 TaxID=1710354 RepID=UPI0006D5FFB3|nr:oligosaccharide flippase family protein [Pseudoalteromonas sp. P1-9]KPV94197.1 Polysaccharide biosynthesis protein [Pseudoalteromonas sp. P1-9]
MKVNAAFVHYGIAIAGLKGISLLMLPIVTRFLAPESYGMLNFLVSIGAMLSIFLGFGMAEVIFRFAVKLPNEMLDSFIASSIKFTFLVSCVFLLCAIVGADIWLALMPLPIEKSYFCLLMFNLALTTLQAIYLTRYRVLQQSKPYMCVALAQGVVQALLTYTLLLNDYGILGVLISGCVTSFIITLVLVIYHRALLLMKREPLTGEHIRYGGFIALSALCLYGLGGAENWFIASYLGSSQLAYYFIATQFSLALSLAFEPFRLWWFPIRFKRYFENTELAASGAVTGCFIITMLALAMMIFAPYLISWLLPQSYHNSSQYIGLLCILLVIKSYAELLNLGCYLDKNAQYVPLINGICATVAILIIAFLTPSQGISGVFAGLFVGHTLRFLAFYIISQRIAPLKYHLGTVLFGFGLLLLQIGIVGNAIWLNVILLIVALLLSFKYAIKCGAIKPNKLGGKYGYS